MAMILGVFCKTVVKQCAPKIGKKFGKVQMNKEAFITNHTHTPPEWQKRI
jgi:hypothetical protein